MLSLHESHADSQMLDLLSRTDADAACRAWGVKMPMQTAQHSS